MYSKITGIGVYLPKRRISNQELINLVNLDSDDEWIKKRTGIEYRHFASPYESNASMAIKASKMAIEEANSKYQKNIDCIIVATNTAVTSGISTAGFPSTSSEVQVNLEDLITEKCPCFNIQTGCAGINFALAISDSLIISEMYNRILVIGTDLLSELTDFNDRATCVLLSDGATAYILDKSNEPGFIGHNLHTDGSRRDYITSPLTQRKPWYSQDTILSPTLKMKGKEVYKFVEKVLISMIVNFETDEKLNPKPHKVGFNKIKKIVAHQANFRMFEGTARHIAKDYKHLNLTEEEILKKFVITINNHGNNSTASQGPGLLEIRNGFLNPGDHILMVSYGADVSWAINHYRHL